MGWSLEVELNEVVVEVRVKANKVEVEK